MTKRTGQPTTPLHCSPQVLLAMEIGMLEMTELSRVNFVPFYAGVLFALSVAGIAIIAGMVAFVL